MPGSEEIPTADVTVDAYKRAYREQRLTEARRGFYVHLAVYVIVNAVLVVINLIVSPSFWWFVFPMAGWGIGVVLNYFGAFRWYARDLERDEADAEHRALTK